MLKYRLSPQRCSIFVAAARHLARLRIIKPKNNVMNSLQNRVQLIGNLGADPEIRLTESGKKMARISIATNEVYRNNKGENIKETQWHNVIAWGKNAELAEKYLNKGSQVAIEGKLLNKNYTDKDGIKKYVTEIQANEFIFLGGKPGN